MAKNPRASMHYLMVLELTPDGTVMNAKGSKNLARQLGYEEQYVIDRNVSEFFVPIDAEHLSKILNGITVDNKPERHLFTFMTGSNGRKLCVVDVAPVSDNGVFRGVRVGISAAESQNKTPPLPTKRIGSALFNKALDEALKPGSDRAMTVISAYSSTAPETETADQLTTALQDDGQEQRVTRTLNANSLAVLHGRSENSESLSAIAKGEMGAGYDISATELDIADDSIEDIDEKTKLVEDILAAIAVTSTLPSAERTSLAEARRAMAEALTQPSQGNPPTYRRAWRIGSEEKEIYIGSHPALAQPWSLASLSGDTLVKKSILRAIDEIIDGRPGDSPCIIAIDVYSAMAMGDSAVGHPAVILQPEGLAEFGTEETVTQTQRDRVFEFLSRHKLLIGAVEVAKDPGLHKSLMKADCIEMLRVDGHAFDATDKGQLKGLLNTAQSLSKNGASLLIDNADQSATEMVAKKKAVIYVCPRGA